MQIQPFPLFTDHHPNPAIPAGKTVDFILYWVNNKVPLGEPEIQEVLRVLSHPAHRTQHAIPYQIMFAGSSYKAPIIRILTSDVMEVEARFRQAKISIHRKRTPAEAFSGYYYHGGAARA